MKEYLNISKISFSNKVLFFLIGAAYFFSFAVRYYYYAWASGVPEFIWNGTLMINNVDGYFYAAGAKEILTGSHVIGDLNPYHSLPSMLTAFIVKLFPFLSLDQVILWMPAFFGSLLVIPLILIGRTLKNDILGVTAALIGSIAWSYYNRTMVGYYDTDMLVIVLLVFVVWGIVEFFVNDDKKMILIVPLIIILYEWWYPQSRTVLLSMVFMAFVYAFFYKKQKDSFFFILLLLFSTLDFDIYINAAAVIVVWGVYYKKPEIFNLKNIYFLYAVVFILLGVSGSFDMLINKFMIYFSRGDINQNNLHFYSVIKTIREASHIPFSVVANRISGNMGLFLLSGLGYLLLLLRYPVMMISLPMSVIGVMAHKLGLRFTIYAVPFFALGFSYLVLLVSEYVSKSFINEKMSFLSKTVLPFLLITSSLYANIKHVILYKTPATFIKQEVASLVKLSKIASPEDYVLTWWDYGYPIRYYAGTKTLIDGGKHGGEDNFPVSYALTHNQTAAANIARLDVEYTDRLVTSAELNRTFKTKGFIPDMMKKYGFKTPDEFLRALNDKNFKLPAKTRNIYFYFPFRMTDIYPTISIFSSIDLKTGKVKRQLIFPTSVIGGNREGIRFSNGLLMDMKGFLHWGDRLVPVNSFYISLYDKKGKFKVLQQPFHSDSDIYIVWYKPLNKVLIVSKNIFNSTYIQMFYLERYDKSLFKKTIVNPFVKIYELKK